MHKSLGCFWLALAMLYLVLAAVSYHFGAVYDQKIANAPTMQATAQGGTTFTQPWGKVSILPGSSPGGDVVVADLWEDLRAYLTASTWVNVFGFGFAAAAAVFSFVSSRCEERRA